MPKILEDKKMKWGDCKVLYSKNVIGCKWMENRSFLLESTALEGMNNYYKFKSGKMDLR